MYQPNEIELNKKLNILSKHVEQEIKGYVELLNTFYLAQTQDFLQKAQRELGRLGLYFKDKKMADSFMNGILDGFHYELKASLNETVKLLQKGIDNEPKIIT